MTCLDLDGCWRSSVTNQDSKVERVRIKSAVSQHNRVYGSGRRGGLVVMLGAVTNLRVKLTFPEQLIKQPLMGRLVREFDVLPNIRRANIEDDVGWIVCELAGERESVEKALSWLVEAGVAVDRLGDVVES
jgi:L-aspartate semialdehyde sulfurtransferase ferredoxin